MSILDAKRNFCLDAAIKLFLDNPIAAVKIKDIAAAAGVGEATIYRYFSNKREIVLACALKLQSDTEDYYNNRILNTSTGYEAICNFYGVFLDIFKMSPKFYHFLGEFDAFCISETFMNLDEYADNMDRFKTSFMAKYRTGIADGSVRKIENIELFYYSTTHAILSLCKKLAAGDAILKQDKVINKYSEIKMLIDTVLFRLKAS